MANLAISFVKNVCSRTLNAHFKYTFPVCNIISNRSFSCTTASFNKLKKYGDKHEWVSLDGKIGTVGITHYAQESLGEVVYIQLPEIGSTCQADDHVGVIESVKAVNEVCSPVSGKITEVNMLLEEKPSLMNEACYDEGWIFKLELSDTSEMEKLMDDKGYEDYLKSME